ncbi:MAG TPA: molybdopterin-dependent oxidoreductase [Planctomycetaceae bacterium]|nr:molybdopterin-dependent oxidoreductase [Planctomycetaceae bacterium]
MSFRLTINGANVEADGGETILGVARRHGIEIPTLCDHPDLSVDGSCRLCLVELAGMPCPVASCAFPAAEGLAVTTESPALSDERRGILEMLLADYEGSGVAHEETEFERWVRHYGAQRPAWARSERRFAVDSDANPFIRVDFNECILCTRCVRACAEVQGRFVWGVAERGNDTRIVAGADTTMLDARCESCGACAAYCPTGALTDRASFNLGIIDRKVTTTCPYCGVGCQFDVNVRDDRVVAVTSNPAAPVNGLSLCVKGRYGHDFVDHPDRLLRPRVRRELLSVDGWRAPRDARGEWVEVDWDTALDLVASKFAAVHRDSGPDALGLLASAKCSNEENYLVQKLARQVLGTHNVDHCARLCHSSTVAGLSMAFGSGAMSNSMDDVAEHAAAMFLIGSNVTEQHPVFGTRIRQAVLRRGMKLVVADPRKIDITEFATLHVQHRPGTDVALLNGLMYAILAAEAHDRDFIRRRTEGFDEFRETVAKYPPKLVAEITGVPVEQLLEAATLLASHRPMAAVWAMGITQHTTGVMNVLCLANLQMLLGNMGVAGGGVNPLRGQNNVQGACDVGALPNVFPGYQAVTDADALTKFDDAWSLARRDRLQPVSADEDRLKPAAANEPATSLGLTTAPGQTVTEMVEAAGCGQIRALYILGENPASTDPDSNHVRRCLEQAEFIVVQEIFPSETAAYADVILPGTSWAERSGTFTNTERRVQLFRQAVSARGDARPDWQIIAELAKRVLELQERQPRGPCAAWNYAGPAEIMDEIAALTPSYTGVSYERLERGERLQWPVPSAEHPGTPILHCEKFTRGKGRFHPVEHLPARELPDHDYPLLLTTGRVLYHWHGGEMTRRSRGLAAVYPESLVEVSPEDAVRLGITDGRPVILESRRGRQQAVAVVTSRVAAGVVFGNFHFPGERNVNNVTNAALDPVAKIPEYKVCAVRLTPDAQRSGKPVS